MKAIDRYNKYKESSLDQVLMKIKSGEIKPGKYARLVHIDKKKIMKDKEELFNDE